MMTEKTCEGCGLCCKYVALEIDKPEDEKDFDQIRWFLIHKNVWVFIDHDNSWNIQFNTPCENLNEKMLCSIHPLALGTKEDHRPKICDDYELDSCEKWGDGPAFKVLFKNEKEFLEWAKKSKKFSKFVKDYHLKRYL